MSRLPTVEDKSRLYNKYVRSYEKRTLDFGRFLKPEYDLFLYLLKEGRKILDLGAGPGRDSLVFARRGFQPLCLDTSEEMLALCRAKGLKVVKMDIERVSFPQRSFDGIWSYTSLTTIPKLKVWRIIPRLRDILKNGGILFLGLIEGTFEGWKPPDEKYDLPRYTSRYQVIEVLENVSWGFELVYFRRIFKEESGRNPYLNFMFRKLR